MRLLRDLWATSPRRTALVAVPRSCSAPPGRRRAAALAGPVLVDRSAPLFVVLAVALVVVVLSDLVVGLIMAGLTADWAADVRRRLCRVAFGQDLPTLETTPVGELLDRIDGDVYQVGVRAARQRRPDRPVAGRRRAVDRHRVLRLVAGRRRRCCCSPSLLVVGAAPPDPADLPGPDERGGGLVRPGRRDGGVDPRPGRRAHQPRPRRTCCGCTPSAPARCCAAAAGCGRCRRGSPDRVRRRSRAGIARGRRRRRVGAGRPAGSTAPG